MNVEDSKKHITSYYCICCSKEIKKIDGLKSDKEWEGMWEGGIVEKISAGYGSIFDGEMYILAICDNCVTEKYNQSKLIYIGDYIFDKNIIKDKDSTRSQK